MFDVHTHHLPEKPLEALFSCCMKDKESFAFCNARYLSAGIHPWFITEKDMNRQLEWLDNLLSTDSRLLAVGEAGLDKLCSTAYTLQLTAFREVINMSERYEQPLFIHCVKASNDIIALKKEYTPSQPWIIHGFRGKKELAVMFLKQGFYLSFGRYFQPEALTVTPTERLLLETDDCGLSVEEVYKQVAQARQTTLNLLSESIDENINRLFFSR